MFRNYFKTAFRNMRRNRLFTGLNIFGLATGLACSIIIFLWVQDELSYDTFNPGADRIFRLTAKVNDIELAGSAMAFAAALKSQVPGVRNATHIASGYGITTVGTRKFDERHMYYADNEFLKIFNYPLLAGTVADALSRPNSVVLTEATAKKYFGETRLAMGKVIYIDSASLQVTGVLKNIPANSHIHFDLLLPIEDYDKQMNAAEQWRFFNRFVYFQLADAVNPNQAVQQQIEQQLTTMRNRAIANNNRAVTAKIFVQPLTDIHLYSHFRGDVDGQGDIQYVRIFTLIAVFIIFIACINFMNLATASSASRAKEVGIRKTAGALRRQLTIQFILESMLLAILSLGLALGLVYLVLPFFNTLASKSITLDLLDWRLIGKVLIITLVVGLLAGSYPAFYLSSFNAIIVLKGGLLPRNKGSFLRNGLVVLQFSISVILIISTVVIYNQLHFLHNRDLGYNKENLLYINIPDVGNLKNNTDALKATLSESPQIGDYTISDDLPTNLNSGTKLSWRGMEPGTQVVCSKVNVDENYIRTFGTKMVVGRFYSGNFEGSDSEYVVNETAVRAMHMEPETALGKKITLAGREGDIIGVVKDFNFKPVHQPIEPLVMRQRSAGEFLVIRIVGGRIQETIALARKGFQRVYGNIPFSYGFVDQDLDHLYRAESRMSTLFNIFSVLSILISCLGLFGLATYATQRRRKEIGVRKVLGAGEAGIVALLTKEFLQLVAIALLVAFPIAWYFMRQWLQGFVYRVNINAWVFAAAGFAALLVASVTVSYQTIKAAMANPTRSLRSE